MSVAWPPCSLRNDGAIGRDLEEVGMAEPLVCARRGVSSDVMRDLEARI